MGKKSNPSGRRGFLKKIAAGAVSIPLIGSSRAFCGDIFSFFSQKPAGKFKGIVAFAKDPGYSVKALTATRLQAAKKLLEKSLSSITGLEEAKEAWGMVAGRDDIVGIKLNCVAAPKLSPSQELVFAIVEGLKLAGVKENNIIMWERSSRELERAGFKINTGTSGVRCFGTDSLDYPFESDLEFSGSIGSLFSGIISRVCTAIINVGVLKDHDLSGVCAGMKNFYGVIHNPNKYHDSNCNPYVADLCNHRYIKGKLRLTVIDAGVCQYNGGPGWKPQWCSEFNSIISGFDMVAVDRVSHDLIESERKKRGLKSLKEEKRYPAFIETAGKLGLGESDLNKIKVIKV